MATKTKDEDKPDQTSELGDESWTSLGPCHYGGEDEEATVMAARSDGTGWIAVCDQHKKDAKKDGFEPDS
jgi:hypothetical protein